MILLESFFTFNIQKPLLHYGTTRTVSKQCQCAGKTKNWLVESILATIFCCLPLGVVGIVYASQVNSKYDAGDYHGAMMASQDAGKWTKIAFFVGIAQFVIGVLFIVFGGFMSGIFGGF